MHFGWKGGREGGQSVLIAPGVAYRVIELSRCLGPICAGKHSEREREYLHFSGCSIYYTILDLLLPAVTLDEVAGRIC